MSACNPSHSFCLYIWCLLPTESGPSWRPPPTRGTGATAPPPSPAAYHNHCQLSRRTATDLSEFLVQFIFSKMATKSLCSFNIPDNQGYVTVCRTDNPPAWFIHIQDSASLARTRGIHNTILQNLGCLFIVIK